MSRLPDAPPRDAREPTPEEREARIRELRTKRHARMRRLAIRSGLVSGGVLILVVAFAWWLLTTIAGRDLLLAQIKARLPADASLDWTRAEGPASGPMTLHGVHFRWKTLDFTAQRVMLDPALRPLLGRRLRLDAMQVENATLDLPPSDTPFELPRWPDSLPQVTVPLGLQADDIRVDGLRITREAAPLIDIRRLRGGVDAGNGRLALSHVAIDSDRGRFALHGTYAPVDHYRTDLLATALVPVKNSRTPLRLGFVARGDLDAMDVALAGAAPGPVRVTLTLRGADRPRWQLAASAHDVDTASLAGTPGDPPQTTDIDFAAQGTGGDGRLQGTIVRGDSRIVVHPSTLHLEQQVLAFAPLDVELLGGRIVARGRGDFGERHDARLDYTLAARGLRWGDGASQVAADADVTVAGMQSAWTVNAQGTLARGGRRAQVALAGAGRHAQLTVQKLEARMPTGVLNANGRVTWRPSLDWNLHANLAGFDPGYFLPAWPGALHGAFATTGAKPSGGTLHAVVDAPRIGGRLRARRVGASAHASLDDGLWRGVAALNVEGGRLQLQGEAGTSPTPRWNATGTLQRFDPSFLVAGWPGAVDAQVRTTGTQRPGAPGQPGVLDATIEVPRLGGMLRGRALSGHGQAHVVGHDIDGSVQLAAGASRLDARGRIGDRLDIDARLSPLQLADLLPDARGVVRGTLRVTGPRTSPDITADLDGRDVAYASYRVGALTARGQLPWQAGHAGALAVHASGLDVGLPLDALDADARGAVENLQLRATAHGPSGALATDATLRRAGADWLAGLASLQLTPTRGAAWQLTRATQVRFGGGRVALAPTCLRSGAGGELCGSADWPRRGADVSARGLPLTLVTGYLPARADGTPWLVSGSVDAQAQLRAAGGTWRGTAHVTSPQGGFRLEASQKADILRWHALDARVTFDPQRLQVELTSGLFDRGRVQGRVGMGWAAHAPLSGDVAIDTDELAWLELFSPDIVDPRGRLAGRITLGGTRLAPQVGGHAQLTGFTTEMPALGIALTQGAATLDAQADGTARISGHVRSGEGTLAIDGRLGWQGTGAPLQLNLRGTNVEVANTRQLRAVANPDVQVRTAAGEPITVSGTVVVPSALLMLERLDSAAKASPDVVVLDPADPQEAKVKTPVALDLALVAGSDVRLQGFGLDGRLAGRVQVRSAPGSDLSARGRMDVSGRYVAYGQRLDVTRGALTWQGGAIGDPILDIRAERDVGGTTAGIDVTGHAKSPRANVWSSDGGTQSEALSMLALGRPLGTVGGEQGRQVGAASAALSAGGSLLASELGARLGLDDAGVIESRTLGGSVLGIGKYLSPRLYVGYGVSLFGSGQVLTLKYLIRRGVDATFESSSVESRASLNYRKEK